jgi:hypothetical protein
MLGVEADRFDHEVEFVGAVDFACDAISHIGLHTQSFAEVIEPVNPLRVAIPQQEHCIRRMFRPRENEQMIGAEVEHKRWRQGAEIEVTSAHWQRR